MNGVQEDMSSRPEILADPVGLGALIASLWLMARWLWKRPPRDRWLGLPACLPLVGVAEHWWHAGAELYGSDSVSTHLWLAAFQVLSFLTAARWSAVPSGSSVRVLPRDDRIGVATTGFAGFSMAMFILAYGDHAGVFVPPFPVNPPDWWKTIAWHGWMFWFLVSIGLVFSSRAMRRGRAAGYIGLALVASFVAWLHWDTFQFGDRALGASVGSVAVILSVCALCWILAGYRVFTRHRSA